MNEAVPVQRSGPRKPKKTWRMNIRYILRSKLHTWSSLEKLVLTIWHPIKYFYWKNRWGLETRLRSFQGERERYINADRIYYVSPEKIVFSSLQEFNLKYFKGHVLAGDWDRLDKRFEDLDIYLAIKQVCVEGKQWDDTIFFQRILKDIHHGGIHYGCRNEKELLEHCHRIESLYVSIQQKGFKSQKELLAEKLIDDPMQAEDEIAISIGRYGDLLFSDGAHRLIIAKLLSLPSIPVKIAVRHKEWIDFREELVFYARNLKISRDNMLYQPATHLDLADLPASHESQNHFQIIKSSTSFTTGSMLDIGAGLGYFCHCFEDLGFDCVAIENDQMTVYFLQRLNRAENRHFKVFSNSVLDNVEIRDSHFNIVLALNIFHHFLKTQEDYARLVDLLNNLHLDEMYFETLLPDESQMEGAYRNFSPEEFVQFISANSMLDQSTLIGRTSDGRPIYKLYRSG
jgi:hypothetical protein